MADRQAETKTVTRKENKEIMEEFSKKSYAKKSFSLILLRLFVVFVLLVLAAIVGAMIGFGVIGDGDMLDVLKPSTWGHVFDIMDGTQDK